MFGVGTDYCLLTGLALPRGAAANRGQARRDGARRAARRPGDPGQRPDRRARDARPRSSRTTGTSSLGPVSAIGVACVARRGPHPAPDPAHDLRPRGLLAAAQHRRLRPRAPVDGPPGRLAALRRPGPAAAGRRLLVTGAVFAAGALGLLAYKVDYSTTSFFKKFGRERRRLRGARAGVPGRDARSDDRAGRSATSGPVTPGRHVGGAADAAGGARASRRSRRPARPRATAASPRSTVILAGRPLQVELRSTSFRGCATPSHDLRSGVTALVGGGSAINYDFDHATAARPRADRAARSAGDGGDPGDPAAGPGRPARAARQRRSSRSSAPSASRSCSSGSSSATPASTPRSRPSPSSSWWRSGSTTRSS